MPRSLFLPWSLLFVVCATQAVANPLSGSLETTASVSNDYESRSLFTNPAALGYQTDLNGSELLTSIAYSANTAAKDSLASALSYGYFALGFEHLQATERVNRYSVGLGFPVWGPLYGGFRYRYHNSDSPALHGLSEVDTGLQIRASKYFSLGGLVQIPSKDSARFGPAGGSAVVGITLRPVPLVDISLDIDTTLGSGSRNWGYQLGAALRPLRGLTARVGYHKTAKWQFGLQWNFDETSVYSVVQPESPANRLVTGVQFSPLPYPSTEFKNKALSLEINGSLKEEPQGDSLFASGGPSLVETLQELKLAAEDESVSSVLIRLDRLPLGLSAAEDIADAIAGLRISGKHVEVFLGQAGLVEYLAAAGANKITMQPSGELRLSGLHVERFFARGTLDKLGVEPEFLARGEYKTAPETFTQKTPSAKNRESTLEELRAAESAVLARLGKYRGIDSARWKQLTELAIFSAADAVKEKLVDAVATETALSTDWESRFKTIESARLRRHDLALPSRVAVIVAEGDILSKRVRVLTLAGHEQITPTKLERLFNTALADSRTKAIVLRVNSAGGEVLASHEIAALVERARNKKPVVVSMGDFAASGGYMIAAPANKIFAQPLSVTGSIGVFLGKFNLKELFRKIDLHKEILSDSPHAGIYSLARPWTVEDRRIMQRRLDQYYESFVGYVAKHRGLSASSAEAAAQGRVWMGHRAKPLKLVDETGGLLASVEAAAKLGGTQVTGYEIWPLEDAPALFDVFGGEGWLARSLGTAGNADSEPLLPKEMSRELLFFTKASEQPFWYLAPYAELR